MWYFSMLYIVCLYHCMYVCYMFIKYQSINQSQMEQEAFEKCLAHSLLRYIASHQVSLVARQL